MNFLELLQRNLQKSLIKTGNVIRAINPTPTRVIWAGVVDALTPFFKDQQKQNEAWAFGIGVLEGNILGAKEAALSRDPIDPANELYAFNQGLVFKPWIDLVAKLLIQALQGMVWFKSLNK